jgi:enoyl-CoA hydratase
MARPRRLNAVDAQMHTELARVFEQAADDDAVDIVVLTGAGRAFCAGGDLHWQRDAIEDPVSFARTVREARRIVLSLLDCEKPVVAEVNGPAVGLGATLALFADAAFIADDTYLSDPHVGVGMTAGDGGAAIWPQLVGYMRAKYYLLTGERVAAVEAARIGLVTAAMPRSGLTEHVDRFVRRLLALPQQAVRSTKVAVNMRLRDAVNTSIDAALALESYSNITRDHREAVDAFLMHRKPSFRAGGTSPETRGSRARGRR